MNLRVLICIALGSLVTSAAVPRQLHAAQSGKVVSWGVQLVPPSDPSTHFVAISMGGPCTLGLRSDGTVVEWGDNTVGEGNVPPGLSNVVAIAAGFYHSAALKSDGTVVAWGDDEVGQTSGANQWTGTVAIDAYYAHNLGLRSDGTVVAAGKLSDLNGGLHPEMVPSGLSNVIAIAAGWGHDLALKADGTVVAWGLSAGDRTPESGLASKLVFATCH